jgi:hypothetical protein
VLAVVGVLVLTVAFFAGTLVRAAVERPSGVLRAVPSPSSSPAAPFVGWAPPGAPRYSSLRTPAPLIGPVYTTKDKVVVRNDLGLPFAFLLPSGWACAPLTTDTPYGIRSDCVDGGATTFNVQLRIMARDCPGNCPVATRTRLAQTWPPLWAPPAGTSWQPAGGSTLYAQVTAGGRYHLWLSQITISNHGLGRMQVGVAIDGPVAQTQLMQKIVNDIRTQA